MPGLKRPSFLPSLDALEQQAIDRSAAAPRRGSQFDHPTAKNLFVVVLVLTVLAHAVGGILFAFLSF